MRTKLKKTKVIATLGPATESYEIKKRMVEAGVNVFRINFSHADYASTEEQIRQIRQISKELGVYPGILADLQGPKIRIGEMEAPALLEEGQTFTLTTRPVTGTAREARINYEALPREVKPGEIILLDDGKIQLEVVSTDTEQNIVTRVIQGGVLRSKKGVNLPDTDISIPALTPKDLQDLDFIARSDFDWLALSFVRSARDIVELKNLLKQKYDSDLPVIAKIEKPEAVKNIKSIIRVSDGVMVARGDLGIEIHVEKVPMIQKKIVKLARKHKKPVIIATQMMESMMENLIPSRAEVNDVANSVMDGADAVMLSGETSVGKHPVEVVERVTEIIRRVQDAVKFSGKLKLESKNDPRFITKMICYYAAETGTDIEAEAITTLTVSGFSAVQTSAYRPKPYVYAFTGNRKLLTRLSLYWGVYPFYYNRQVSTDETIRDIIYILKKENLVKPGDFAINLTAMPLSERGMVNTMRITRIKPE
ncbi:MAG: pyruvate kinase [Chlorobi bacterium]|nr:pyruvate kinase [Chlorobiota bacterium]